MIFHHLSRLFQEICACEIHVYLYKMVNRFLKKWIQKTDWKFYYLNDHHKERPITSPKQELQRIPEFVRSNFSMVEINQKWVTYITYIYKFSDSWCYSPNILDVYSWKIIAWCLPWYIIIGLVIEKITRCLEYANYTR